MSTTTANKSPPEPSLARSPSLLLAMDLGGGSFEQGRCGAGGDLESTFGPPAPPTQRCVLLHRCRAGEALYRSEPSCIVFDGDGGGFQKTAIPVLGWRLKASRSSDRCFHQQPSRYWGGGGGQPQPQQLRLYTVEGNPAGYKTKWEELHPASQEPLLQIEEKTREYMHQREQLDQCSRLYDPSVSNKGFELDACQITQEIGLISTIMDGGEDFHSELNGYYRRNHVQHRFCYTFICEFETIRRGAGIANAGFGKCAGPSGAPTDFNQPLTKAPTFRCFRGDVMRPSFFMQQIVARFEMKLEECCRMIGELEQVVQMKNGKTYPDALESLPKVMSNMHYYFIHVAAKVENVHQYAQTIRTQYLNGRRHRGDWNDPFLEGDKKDAAKHEAADRNLQFSSRWKNTW